MADPGGLELNDLVVSKVDEGHLLLIVTTLPLGSVVAPVTGP
jgi:hypothetical protein